MKYNRKHLDLNWVYIILTLLTGFTVIIIFISITSLRQARLSSENFADFYLQENKERVRHEVENRLDEIYYALDRLEEQELDRLGEKLRFIYWTLSNSDAMNPASISERKALATKEYDRLMHYKSDDTFFLIDSDGTILRSSTANLLNGVNMKDTSDEKGNYYVRDFLKAIHSPEGIVTHYYWPKSADTEPTRKTSYCIYLPEFDLIIGSGVYEVDIQQKIKQDIFDMLHTYYQDSDDYIFVTGYDSTCYVASDPNLVGTKLDSIRDNAGTIPHEIIMNALEKNPGTYVAYDFFKKSDHSLSSKISYVETFDLWNIYIGMGFHIDELNAVTEDYTKNYKSQHYEELLYITIGLVFISLIVFALIQRGALLQINYLKQEEVLFMQLFQFSDESIIIVSSDGKILYQNDKLELMLPDGEINNYFNDGILEFDEIKRNIYKITNNNGRTFYTEINKKSIVFHGKESSIYFIKNISEQYIETNKYEKMALIDELTSLPNRRALTNHFEDMFFNKKQQSDTVIAIIDLDHFKLINDTYGHNIGDEVIKLLAKNFQNRLRHNDFFYRYGGEEFVVIFKETTLEASKSILEEINKNFCNEVLVSLGFESTFSAGAILIDWNNLCSLQNTLELADVLLYQAKNKGRNLIEIYLDHTN